MKTNNADNSNTEYHDNGQKSAEGTLRNGKKDGTWTFWTQDGLIAQVIEFQNDQAHGNAIVYDANGNKHSEGRYNRGIKEGNWQEFYINGIIKTESRYRSDKKNGSWTEYFESGVRHIQGAYQNDEPDGLWQTYYENGKMAEEKRFYFKQLDGFWARWDERGQKLEEGHYRSGKKDGRFALFYPDGRRKEEGSYRNDVRDGQWTHWHENGQKASEGRCSAGQREGAWAVFDETGKKIGEETYREGQLISEPVRSPIPPEPESVTEPKTEVVTKEVVESSVQIEEERAAPAGAKQETLASEPADIAEKTSGTEDFWEPLTQESLQATTQRNEVGELPREDLHIDIAELDKIIENPKVQDDTAHAPVNQAQKNKTGKKQKKQANPSSAQAQERLAQDVSGIKTKSQAMHPLLFIWQKWQEKLLTKNEALLFVVSVILLLLMAVGGIQFLFGFVFALPWPFAVALCGVLLWQKQFFVLSPIAFLGAYYSWHWPLAVCLISVALLTITITGLYQLMLKNHSTRKK